MPSPSSPLAVSRRNRFAGRLRIVLLAWTACVVVLSPAVADVAVPPVIGSHMVLQRGMPVPIWGSASPHEQVSVQFRDQKKSTEADAEGRWTVKLDALQPGAPASLVIQGKNSITLEDVLVGEVWLGSGQSNMETHISDYITDTLTALPAAERGKLLAEKSNLIRPKDAAGKYHLRDEALAELARQTYPNLRLFTGGSGKGWREANPENLPSFSALFFVFGQALQKELGVPVGLVVGSLGATSSEQWINRRDYEADSACKEALARFATTYSLDAEQQKYQGALTAWEKANGPSPAPSAPPKPTPPLHPGEVTRDTRQPGKNIGELYEQFIRPLIPFAIRGVLWDQGEGGTGILGLDQSPLMAALIGSWRKDWQQGDYPFVYVQKPSGGGCAWDSADPVTRQAEPFASALPTRPPPSRAGLMREDYVRVLRTRGTEMVTTSDLGDGTHPINKSGYGARACRVVLGTVYGRSVEAYGPRYEACEVVDGSIRLRFTHIGKGLAARSGSPLQGFQIAGSDKVFAWADARIDGDTVVVSSARVPHPVAVRYAWGREIPWANLFNRDGLPALTFRTDDWNEN